MSTNRREFIKAFSLLTGAGIMAGQFSFMKELAAADTGRIVKLGIIGVGSRGQLLLQYLKDIPELDICCFAENYQPNFTLAQEMIGPMARGYIDYRLMLEKEELDAVVIATPLYEHAHITIAALDAGLHVFCEKAMAMNYDDCNAMVEAHIRNHRILHIGHQRLYNAKYLQTVRDIREGLIGPVTQIRAYWHRNNDWRRPVPSPELERKINWRLYTDYSRGLMTELASHQIQVANWVLDEKPDCVWGAGSINHWKDGREVYDNVSLVYRYRSGTQLVYDSMTSNAHYGLEEQIMGPLGTIEPEQGKRYREFPEPASGIVQLINQIEKKVFEVVPMGGASWVPDNPSEDRGDYIINEVLESDGTRMQMEAFIANVRQNRIDSWITKEAFYASIATLMGYEAMTRNEVVYWPENLIM